MAESLPPYPDGWFFVCYAHELKPGKLVSKTFLGEEVVAFRDRSGAPAVLDAICPHLGAHMGHGGCVKGGELECPFHRFRFDASGACTHVPGAPPPRAARARTWPTHEVNGLVLAYHGQRETAPTWYIPELCHRGWSSLATHHYRIKGHPQETTENGVDAAHLQTIHGYSHIEMLRPTQVEGAHLHSQLRMRRDSRGPLGRLGLGMEVRFDIHVWGLGYSLVDIEAPAPGMRVRLWTLSTPRDGTLIDLHIALRVKYLDRPGRLLPGLQLVPKDLLRGVALQFAKRAYMHDIEQDFFIWENKRYLSRPRLAQNDGPIGIYRRYCRQFYPEPDAPASVPDRGAAE